MGEIIFNKTDFLQAMKKISMDTGIEFPMIMRDQMALWIKELMAKTPPFKSKNSSHIDASSRQLGERRVANDILKVIYGVPNSQSDQFGADWIAYSGGSPIGHLFKTDRGAVYAVEQYYIDTDGSKIPSYHQSQRQSRGRVLRQGKMSKRGKFFFLDKMHAPISEVKKYIEKKAAHVGKTKSGWLSALYFFCGKSNNIGLPGALAWIARHGAAAGSYLDRFDAQALAGEWRATNNIPWVTQTAINDLMAATRLTRLRDLLGGWYSLRMQKILDRVAPA